MVCAMCMDYVVVVLSLLTPSFATTQCYFVASDEAYVCSDFVDGNFVWGPIYLVYNWCYE